MRKEEIKDLIRIVEESQITELEVTEGRRRIRISRVAGAAWSGHAHPSELTSNSAPAPPVVPLPESDMDATGKLASNLKQITSPMVGTFYRAPAPGSDPFIDIGQAITVGQTVCIVEAMKLMNEIGSDFSGVVRQILIENAQPVEYGQPLFLVEIK